MFDKYFHTERKRFLAAYVRDTELVQIADTGE